MWSAWKKGNYWILETNISIFFIILTNFAKPNKTLQVSCIFHCNRRFLTMSLGWACHGEFLSYKSWLFALVLNPMWRRAKFPGIPYAQNSQLKRNTLLIALLPTAFVPVKKTLKKVCLSIYHSVERFWFFTRQRFENSFGYNPNFFRTRLC